MPNPHIPATLGEVLFVSLTHVLDYLAEHGTYPERMSVNMRKVLAAYARDRRKALGVQGISPEGIDRYTAMATESLDKWLDQQATRVQAVEGDFDKWAEELTRGDD